MNVIPTVNFSFTLFNISWFFPESIQFLSSLWTMKLPADVTTWLSSLMFGKYVSWKPTTNWYGTKIHHNWCENMPQTFVTNCCENPPQVVAKIHHKLVWKYVTWLSDSLTVTNCCEDPPQVDAKIRHKLLRKYLTNCCEYIPYYKLIPKMSNVTHWYEIRKSTTSRWYKNTSQTVVKISHKLLRKSTTICCCKIHHKLLWKIYHNLLRKSTTNWFEICHKLHIRA